jgi:hypothetical protein
VRKGFGLYLVIGLSIFANFVFVLNVFAAQPKAADHKGLLIAPIRQYVNIDAGKATEKSTVVANHTKEGMDVTLYSEEFSVADYSYDYRFNKAKLNWVKLGQNFVQLKPGESKTIKFQIDVPPLSTPGGQYFTLFAETKFKTGSIVSKVQATSLLYVTVNGELDKSSLLKNQKIERVSIGSGIPFELDIQNTGNTHYFANINARLNGVLADKSQISNSHIVLPGSIRRIDSAIPAPLLPGIYEAVYGYTIEGKPQVQKSAIILYAPPWSWVVLLILLIAGFKFWQFKKRKHFKSKRDSTPS